MTDAQQRSAAKQFAADWAGKGYEKGTVSLFGLHCFLRSVAWPIGTSSLPSGTESY